MIGLALGIGTQILAIEGVKTTGGKLELLSGCRRGEPLGSMLCQEMANERSGQAMDQLRFVFMLRSLADLGDSVPQTSWDFTLFRCSSRRGASIRPDGFI